MKKHRRVMEISRRWAPKKKQQTEESFATNQSRIPEQLKEPFENVISITEDQNLQDHLRNLTNNIQRTIRNWEDTILGRIKQRGVNEDANWRAAVQILNEAILRFKEEEGNQIVTDRTELREVFNDLILATQNTNLYSKLRSLQGRTIQNVDNWNDAIFDGIKQEGGDETEEWRGNLEQLNEMILRMKENEYQEETEEQNVTDQKRRKRSSWNKVDKRKVEKPKKFQGKAAQDKTSKHTISNDKTSQGRK